jgi:hypothetical protein
MTIANNIKNANHHKMYLVLGLIGTL